ncbi:MAG: PAS domain-containing protein [Bacteroidia bacterium]|nr:PAS domain-containing protein [Bacteroidia bacterium]
MEIFQIISIILLTIVITLVLLLLNIRKKNNKLSSKLNDTMGIIEERLSLANKYSKTLAAVADKTFEAVIITDKNGIIEWVNTGFTNITGYSFLEVKGKKPGEVLQGPETDKATINRIREKLKEKKIFKEEILNYHKEGRKYWLSLSITPVLDADNNIEKFIAIESDITEQKNQRLILEQKLKEITG